MAKKLTEKINESIFKKAYELLKTDGFYGIYKASDIGDAFVFYGGNPNEVYYGIRTVSVDKKTGEVDWYDLNANIDILKNGNDINIPNKYMYKES